jgi:hypothetical protein
MSTFGKRIDGVNGGRGDSRRPVLVAAAMIALPRSGPATVVNVSCTGARLRGRALPQLGEDALIKVRRVEAFGRIVWNHDDLCGMHFDCPLSQQELQILEQQTEAVLITRLTPEEALALEDWSTGMAR